MYMRVISLLTTDVKLMALAQRTPGFRGADLENLFNEAALVAAALDLKSICRFRQATDLLFWSCEDASLISIEEHDNVPSMKRVT